MKSRVTIALLLLVASIVGCFEAWHVYSHKKQATQLTTVRFGISPFQDTLVPIIGARQGWYKEQGLDVKFSVLGWTQVQEALASGSVDVAINNISSIVGTHPQDPNLVYWYATNPFDNGFALMVRPNGTLKTLSQIEATVSDHTQALKLTAAQLLGKTVITTSNTDMEQGVVAAAQVGGLDFTKDVKIINLPPDQGLAAFLHGQGDAYIGGIPQRTAADKAGMLEMLSGADLASPPINGFVTTKAFAAAHEDVLLKLLHVWFQSVNYVDNNLNDGATIITTELDADTGSTFSVSDFEKYWNNYEHYPANPTEVQSLILDPTGKNYWKAQWDASNSYLYNVKHAIPEPVDPSGVFLMEKAQKDYIAAYGPN